MCKELCSVAPGHSTHYEAATHLPTQVSREATLGSNKEAPFDDATHRSKDGIRSGSMQCNQCPLGTATTASRDEDHGWEVGSSGMKGISATTCSSRRSIGTPIEYFKRLLEEACPNFAYPMGYKLKDCSMIQSFMTSGERRSTVPQRECHYDGFLVTPLVGRHRMSSLGLGISTHGGWGLGG
jgi:hypothetical protein